MSHKKSKVLRKHIKDCKRLLRVLYRKGILDAWMDSHIHWADYRSFNKKLNYRHLGYIEPYYWTNDYWGEHDQRLLFSDVITNYLFETLTPNGSGTDYELIEVQICKWLKKHKKFKDELAYFESLPTKRCDSGINKYLKVKYD